ncbi:MAG: PIN domain-containing protein [Clostridiales bacterium]|nr:PIN domain-containing protein [Clostridiales bacterium]
MMVVFDNNIVLDALLERKPFYAVSERLLMACASEHSGYLTANSLTDIFYVLSKHIGAVKAKQATKKLIELFTIISVDWEDCLNALELPLNDFEDALIIACAKKTGIDYIVTRDNKFLDVDSPIPVLSIDQLLEILNC